MPKLNQRLAVVWSLVLFVVVVVAFSVSAPAASVTFVEAGHKTIQVEIADTPAKRMTGLMYRRSLPDGRGMWFDFSEDRFLAFWMKNVIFPIDIIFVDSGFYIRKIWSSVPPCQTEPCDHYDSGAKVRYVIEVQSEFCQRNGIREKQRIIFRP